MGGADGAAIVSTIGTADALVVAIKGDLDLASAGELVGAVEALEPLVAPVTVDVSGLEFVDSAGLRALLNVRERVERSSRARLRLVGVGGELHSLLELCGLLDAFDVERREP